jgi:hypothetical protein
MRNTLHNISIKKGLVVLFLILLFIPHITLAQAPTLEVDYIPFTDDFPFWARETAKQMMPEYLRYIFNFIVITSGIVVMGVLIYGGFTFLTSSGNPQKMTKGKEIITNGIIGLILILSSWLIISLINPSLLNLSVIDLDELGEEIAKDAYHPNNPSYLGPGVYFLYSPGGNIEKYERIINPGTYNLSNFAEKPTNFLIQNTGGLMTIPADEPGYEQYETNFFLRIWNKINDLGDFLKKQYDNLLNSLGLSKNTDTNIGEGLLWKSIHEWYSLVLISHTQEDGLGGCNIIHTPRIGPFINKLASDIPLDTKSYTLIKQDFVLPTHRTFSLDFQGKSYLYWPNIINYLQQNNIKNYEGISDSILEKEIYKKLKLQNNFRVYERDVYDPSHIVKIWSEPNYQGESQELLGRFAMLNQGDEDLKDLGDWMKNNVWSIEIPENTFVLLTNDDMTSCQLITESTPNLYGESINKCNPKPSDLSDLYWEWDSCATKYYIFPLYQEVPKEEKDRNKFKVSYRIENEGLTCWTSKHVEISPQEYIVDAGGFTVGSTLKIDPPTNIFGIKQQMYDWKFTLREGKVKSLDPCSGRVEGVQSDVIIDVCVGPWVNMLDEKCKGSGVGFGFDYNPSFLSFINTFRKDIVSIFKS